LFFPLVKQGIESAQSTAKNNNIELNLTLSTNATLLDMPKLEYLKSCSNLELAINSYTFDLVNRGLISSLLKFPVLTINMLISPEKVFRFSGEFMRFYNMGFRRVNILPAYYTDWTSGQLSALEKELKKICKFLGSGNRSDDIYIKNLYVKGEVALYNSSPVVDYNGDVYPNNLILSAPFLSLKPLLRLGNILDMNDFSQIKESDIDIHRCINRCLSSSKLSSAYKADEILDNFLDSLGCEKKGIIEK